MSERNYYVICEDNCKFEGMTKEQILAAITQAVEQGEIHDVDTGFVTKIKEQNAGRELKFWVGTQAQYNAIETPATNVMYLITDPQAEAEIEAQVAQLREDVDAIPRSGEQLWNGVALPDLTVIDGMDKYNVFEIEIGYVGTARKDALIAVKDFQNNVVGSTIIKMRGDVGEDDYFRQIAVMLQCDYPNEWSVTYCVYSDDGSTMTDAYVKAIYGMA